MTVKEVVLLAATHLGIVDEVESYVENKVGNGKNTLLLVDCFNLVENEIALDYLPLYAEEEKQTLTGKIEYSAFQKPVTRVLKVTGADGAYQSYTCFPDCIKTSVGKIKIFYAYSPYKKTIDDCSDYETQVSTRLLSYGVAAEYATAMGLYEEASVWDKKYKDALAAAYALKPTSKMPSRGWV